jgi:DNA adenine methylase
MFQFGISQIWILAQYVVYWINQKEARMQLTLENRYATYYPPKFQLLKWVGNKQRFAAKITRFFPADYGRYFEPFLGSGAVLATVSPFKSLASDTFGPLMEIWKMLKRNPKLLIEWYAVRRNRIGKETKEQVYDTIRTSYNKEPNGADFLFLARACYGGIVRFRKADGHMSTPCGAHIPISVESFAKRVEEWRNRVKHVNFARCDYQDAFAEAKRGDLIYCDPPYSDSQAILYGSQGFKLSQLMNEIEIAKSKGIKVALSIDGRKKSGDHVVKLDIPAALFEEEIFIDLGNSMLRRFQLSGQSLKGEEVADRLLLTY